MQTASAADAKKKAKSLKDKAKAKAYDTEVRDDTVTPKGPPSPHGTKD